MRMILALLVIVCFWVPPGACRGDVNTLGVTFTLGFESYPGKLFYRLDGIRYVSGTTRDHKYNPMVENVTFAVFSARVARLVPLGWEGLSAGLELGISTPLSGYSKSWSLPALAPKFTGDIYFPSFC